MNFKQEIQKRGMKLNFFAEKVGIKPQQLSMYLSGTRSMPEKIERDLRKAVSSIPVPR